MSTTEGHLAETLRVSMQRYEAMRAAGASVEQAVSDLAKTVRLCWPFTREWKYLCACGDSGLTMATCPGDATCGRHAIHGPHTFGTPCWCQVGRRFQHQPKAEQDFTQATKSKPMKRLGR